MTARRTTPAGGTAISRRHFIQITGAGFAGAALIGLAGCGGGGGGSSSGEFIFSFGPDTSGSLEELVRRFNKRFKGEYTANYREMPADTGQYFDRLRTQFQAGGGDIDLIGGDVIWPAQFAGNGWILDVSDRFPKSEQNKFLDGPIQSLIYEGNIYGVPWFTDAGMLYYRQDLLEKSGFSEPPGTWEELKEQAGKTAQDTDTRSGFVFQGSNYEGGVVNGLEYIYSFGGNVLDPKDSSKVVIDSQESVDGLAMERSMVEDGIAPQAVANYAETESHTAFLNGDAVFLRNWPYVYGLIGSDDFPNVKKNQVGVAPLPAGPAGSKPGLGGWNFMVNAQSDAQDAAYRFVEFATAPEQQKFRALEGGFLPTLKSLYDDQEIVKAIPVIRLAGQEALQNATPRPVSPYYSDMSLKMAEQFNNVVKGAATPQQAVQRLQQDLQQIVEQAQ